METRQWWTVEQIAEALHVNPETVRRWVRDGHLKAELPGGRRLGFRVARGDLSAFVEKWYGETLGERLGETEAA